MAENRTPRDLVSREKTARQVWVPASTLPQPHPRPGIVHRWIATAVVGETDPRNVSRRMREGWEPVKASDYPEVQIPGNRNGNIEMGGLMLCAMPAETVDAREQYFADVNKRQIESVDNNFMRENDERMPLFSEKNSTVSRSRFGSGSR